MVLLFGVGILEKKIYLFMFFILYLRFLKKAEQARGSGSVAVGGSSFSSHCGHFEWSKV
jgi:hypothetical protein